MEFGDSLTHAERERLAILAEEMAEAIQIVGKILRHGYRSFNPWDKDEVVNRELLCKEIGHVLAAIDMMKTKGDLPFFIVERSMTKKRETIKGYLHFQNE